MSNVLPTFHKTYIAPFLKDQGFIRQGTSYYRQRGDIVDCINFQGSRNNSDRDDIAYYINCCMDSVELRADDNTRPKYYTMLYYRRHNDITGDQKPQQLLASQGVLLDQSKCFAELETELTTIIAHFDTIRTTLELILQATRVNYLAGYEVICDYLVRTHQIDILRKYIDTLRERFIDDDRWPFFAERIRHIIGDYAHTIPFVNLLTDK